MRPWKRASVSIAAITVIVVPFVGLTTAGAQPPSDLSISYDGAEYAPAADGVPLDDPVSKKGDATETVEEHNVDGEAIRFVAYGADGRVANEVKELSSGTSDSELSENPGTTRADGSFVIDESVEASGPKFSERTVPAEEINLAEVEPTLAIAHSDRSVAVSWEAMDVPERDFQLSVNGEIVAEGTGSGLEASLPESEHRSAELVLEDPAGILPDTVRTFDLAAAGPSGQFQTMGYQTNSTAYLHVTFIPDARVSINSFQNLGCGEIPGKSVSFGGDNRSWRLPARDFPLTVESVPTFRTLVYVYVNWQNPVGDRINEMVGINATTKYVDGKLVETRRFSGPGALLQNPAAAGNSATFKVLHRAANPFCSVGAIVYEEQVTMYRATGMVEVSGFRWPVPAHEIYARTDLSNGQQQWETLSRRSNEGFHCLAAAAICGKDQYVLSN